METRAFCRRCLLEDMPSEAALLQSVRELIALLPEESRVPESLRTVRLAKCRACNHLNGGTCALCGCFVELRTAKARLSCPDVPSKWPAVK